MSGEAEEWWETEVEVEAEPGPPAVRKPRELDEVAQYRVPSTITAKWISAQLSKDEWRDAKSSGTKLNSFLIESMCRDAKKGLSKRSVMARAGYAASTWTTWERKAAEGVQPYALWYQCMMLSYSSVEEEQMDNIRMAGQSDWKASKWILEQINKDEYSPTPKNQTVNIAGDVNNSTENSASINYMSDDKALEVASLLQQFGVIPQIENTVEGEVVSETEDQDS